MDRRGGGDPADPHEHDPHEHDPRREGAEDGGGMFWRVAPGAAPGLAAAYRAAVQEAGELSAALAAAGLGDQVVAVTAGLDAAGEPLVCGVITLAGARRLAEFLAAGGPPPPGLQLRAGRPPWAA